jgi:hypothetical protein
MVRMGGNSARIQGEEANWGVRMEMSPPARMLSVLKEMAMRVWADVDL